MAKKTVCVLGGTGFIGKQLLLALSQAGYTVQVITRHKRRHMEIENYPNVSLVELDVFDSSSLNKTLIGFDTVINLVGILNNGRGGSSCQHVHIDLAKKLVQALDGLAVSRLIQVSALNADTSLASSAYLQTKGEAENVIRIQTVSSVETTIFRPSIVYGSEGGFVRLFTQLLSVFKVLPLACPKAKVAPVYVGDLVNLITSSINNPQTYGQSYDVCGERVFTMHELVKEIASARNSKTYIVPLPNFLSKLQAKIFTMDNYEALQHEPNCKQQSDFMTGFKRTNFKQWLANPQEGQRDNYSIFRKKVKR